jgi:hypothetical protein
MLPRGLSSLLSKKRGKDVTYFQNHQFTTPYPKKRSPFVETSLTVVYIVTGMIVNIIVSLLFCICFNVCSTFWLKGPIIYSFLKYVTQLIELVMHQVSHRF